MLSSSTSVHHVLFQQLSRRGAILASTADTFAFEVAEQYGAIINHNGKSWLDDINLSVFDVML